LLLNLKTAFVIISFCLFLLTGCTHKGGPGDGPKGQNSIALKDDAQQGVGRKLTSWTPPYGEVEKLAGASWSKLKKLEVATDWFDVYEVLPGVRAIHEPGHWESVTSYLIEGNDMAILFESGLGIASIKEITRQLTALPTTVVSSHSHYDHVGGNHLFDHVWAHVNDFTRINSKGTPNAKARLFVPAESFNRKPPASFDRETYSIKPWVVTKELVEGDMIDLGGRQLEVIQTPGHAPDSVCLLDRAARLLFTGDAFYLGSIFAQLPESNVRDFSVSLQKLSRLQDAVDWLMPAHSPPTQNVSWLSEFRDTLSDIVAGRANWIEHDQPPWGLQRIYPHSPFWVITTADWQEAPRERR